MTTTSLTDITSDQVVGAIVAGQFDDDLHRIIANAKRRQKRALQVSASALEVGDHVRLHDNISPKYVAGTTGVVKAVDAKGTVSVYLDSEAVRHRAARYLDYLDQTIRLKASLVTKVEG